MTRDTSFSNKMTIRHLRIGPPASIQWSIKEVPEASYIYYYNYTYNKCPFVDSDSVVSNKKRE